MTVASRQAVHANTPFDSPEESPYLSRGPIVAATDSSSEADAAIVAAELVSTRTGAPVQVVSVLEPFVATAAGWDSTPVAADVFAERHTRLREAVKAQLQRVLPADTAYPITILTGAAAPSLAVAAHDRHARLLTLGRGRHGLAGRLFLGETIPRLLQLADVPLLAAEPGFDTLPRRVLIATDFSPYSVFAARVALSVVDPDTTFFLAHVAPEIGGYHAAFERVREEIGIEPGRVQTMVLTGDPSRALVDFATSMNVDLVVSGTHGYGFFNRLVLGSVATQLVRGAPCSVLVVPGSAAARTATREQIGRGQTRAVPADEWSDALTRFSQRNLGRRSTLEVDDPALGAQVQGTRLSLVGADFDTHGTAVQLMFGALGRTGRHLSHVVSNVSGLEVLGDADGRDRALRVLSDSGSTLLTFID
jgi:nucleotide-binding universal stress UspA family protein